MNWSAALQTQGYVRQEWADTGLPFFTSLEFQRSLDRVCDRMGVTSDFQHNRQNNVILEGARKLGYAAKSVPQNTGHGEHYCGYCTLGCASGGKKGPIETWLADAAKAINLDIVQTDSHLVVSALAGDTAAGGVPLALAGDYVVAREDIVLNPYYRHMGGLYGSEYWTYLLPRRVGRQMAARLTGAPFTIGARVMPTTRAEPTGSRIGRLT